MRHRLPSFAELFSEAQRGEIREAPMFSGQRHPVWAPLFYEEGPLHAGHHRLDQSVKLIGGHPNGKEWLEKKVETLLDQSDVNNASAAMAEIRAFGGLLEAGFEVCPVRETAAKKPDFIAKTGCQAVAVEVAAKHQDREQDKLQGSVHDEMRGKGRASEGVGRSAHHRHGAAVVILEWEHQPFGCPDPEKPHDSVQTNAISRVCAVKEDEQQIPDDMAAVLVVDFNDFGGPLAPFTLIDQTAPVIAGNHGFTSGALWHAFYGWKGAPVFEGVKRVEMRHDGRFQMKSRFSGALLVMPEHAVFFEHPEAAFPLTEETRLRITRFPWFDLTHSVLEWAGGDVGLQVDLHRRMIARVDAMFEEIKWG